MPSAAGLPDSVAPETEYYGYISYHPRKSYEIDKKSYFNAEKLATKARAIASSQ